MHCREKWWKHFLHGSPSQYPSVFYVFPFWPRTTAVATASPHSVPIPEDSLVAFSVFSFQCPSFCPSFLGTVQYEQTKAVMPTTSSCASVCYELISLPGWLLIPPWAWPICPLLSVQGPLVQVPMPAGAMFGSFSPSISSQQSPHSSGS